MRYKFQVGENLVWKVEHRARVRTTVSGSTQTADTTSISTKRWKITAVQPDGKFSFVHSVDYVDMRQQMSDREEERFDSRTDKSSPPGFGDVAKAVGVPLTVATLDAEQLLGHLERYDGMENLGVECPSALVYRLEDAPPLHGPPPESEPVAEGAS